MRCVKRLETVAFLSLLLLSSVANGQTALVIQGARIVPVEGAVLESGSIVIVGEQIQAVGERVEIPAGAQIVDGKGLTVYPGLIDAYCLAGVAAPPSAPPAAQSGGAQGGQRRGGQTSPPPAPPAPLPWRKATEGFNASAQAIAAMRNNGYTSALFGTRGVLTPGENVLMNLVPGDPAAMLMKERASINLNTQSRGFNAYPSTLMGAFAFLRQSLYDGLDYRNRKPEKVDSRLESLGLAAEGKIPVFYSAQNENDIRRGLKIAAEFKLRLLVLGGRESEKMLAQLKQQQAAVVLTDDWSPATALAKAGVPFALASNQLEMSVSDADNLRAKSLALVEKGLAPEAVLSALTLVPAQLLGVSDRIGTIAPGKIANLVVTDGDLFKKETKIRFTIIQGRRIEPTPLKAETAPRPKPLPEDGVAYADIDHDDACIHVGEDDRR
jgi:hypothetical protein